MSELDLYKGVIMQHYRHPHNRGDFSGDMSTSRVYNALCGDDIEVGVIQDEVKIHTARFKGRACSICIASSSMMTEVVSNMPPQQVKVLLQRMIDVFSTDDECSEIELPEPLNSLLVVKQHNSRKRCITLPWEALAEII